MNRTMTLWSAAGRSALLLVALCMKSHAAGGPVLETNVARPLRYHPEGTDFVIENGAEYFNRPLYGTNTAFRVDAGDRPEFSLYLPGRGGNLRMAVRVGASGAAQKVMWVDEAKKVVARYRPGGMIYEVSDDGFGLEIDALALADAEGVVVKVERKAGTGDAAGAMELLWAYGGANGDKGSRDGDIGTEKEPVTKFFQLRPEYCTDDVFTKDGAGFRMKAKVGMVVGTSTGGPVMGAADATRWSSAGALWQSRGNENPKFAMAVMTGVAELAAGKPVFVGLEKVAAGAGGELAVYTEVGAATEAASSRPAAVRASGLRAEELEGMFAAAEKKRAALAATVVVDTPDPFINAAMAALCVAGDGVWDEPSGAVTHGAVAWRTKLLGWRGPYLNDELGWHDRAVRHIEYWAAKQNTKAVPDVLAPADAAANLARNEAALHSNGDIANSHYDMNLVYIDMLMRHFLWTGDLELAKKMWPVIERHLAWERRLFRRPYGPEGLPLYEGYCDFWASDDVEYSGGGTAHASAYNYFHNVMAGRIARAIGQDPGPYEKEAALIHEAMEKYLWVKEKGIFGEYKDWLGLQMVHESPALWTFYTTIDSGAATPMEAWQMSRFVDTQIAHIPMKGAGVPDEGLFTLPTTNWMPYTWSTNNVVMAEAAHTALAYWQTNRRDEAFKLFKGCLLDSMYMGLCPGNAGMCTQFDMARGESQRDFADAVGMSSRAMVEGLFGVRPDALAGELVVRPGFPQAWERASIRHPDFEFSYERQGDVDRYVIKAHFARPMKLRLQMPVRGWKVAAAGINGVPADWSAMPDCVDQARIEIAAPPAAQWAVVIRWETRGYSGPRDIKETQAGVVQGEPEFVATAAQHIVRVTDPQGIFSKLEVRGTDLSLPDRGARDGTIFVEAHNGDLSWVSPMAFQQIDSLTIRPSDDTVMDLFVQGHTNHATGTAQVSMEIGSMRLPMGDIDLSRIEKFKKLQIPVERAWPGTNKIRVIYLGEDKKQYEGRATIQNWDIPVQPERLEPVNVETAFNDRVTHIFTQDYLSPRSPFCSLSQPKQGIGSWARFTASAEINDAGLRRVAAANDGKVTLPCGVFFKTPGAGDAKNIAFTSQYDNYPREISVPLSGKAAHAYFLMAGSTNWMQSRIANGDVTVNYGDGTSETLVLENPTNWWPIEQDYLIDDFAFARPGALPPRIDLATGKVRMLDMETFKGKGGKVNGGAATVLDMPLDGGKELKNLRVRTLANECVIGLMAVTLGRP